MKNIYYLLFGLFLFSCASQHDDGRIAKFDWMIGEWERVDEKQRNQVTYETWQKESDENYIGHGFVMLEQDTIWQEIMKLEKLNEEWKLQVITSSNNDAVSFTLTSINQNTFLAENPAHDFPKMIQYWLENDNLMARVGDDENSIDFKFIKLKE